VGVAAGKGVLLPRPAATAAWASARAAAAVPALTAMQDPLVEVRAGQVVSLAFRAVPGAAVTVMTMDGGRITPVAVALSATAANRATVVADDAGIARVDFHATPDVVNVTAVQAASPAASGLVRQAIRVVAP